MIPILACEDFVLVRRREWIGKVNNDSTWNQIGIGRRRFIDEKFTIERIDENRKRLTIYTMEFYSLIFATEQRME